MGQPATGLSSCTRLTVQHWVFAKLVCKPLSWKALVLVSSVFELLLGAQMRVAGLGLHLCASPLACSRRRVQGLHEGLGKVLAHCTALCSSKDSH
jgi:hypothetical protein